ncbi:MAG: ATP/GTP-binding protein [Hyphomicrobiales bacterium]
MIDKISLKNFQIFTSFETNDLKPINIIIGKNDTGKTGLLKLLYTYTKSLDEYAIEQRNANSPRSIKEILSKKVINTFSGIGKLVNKGSNEKLEANIYYSSGNQLEASFTKTTEKQINQCSIPENRSSQTENAIFIPAKEVLSIINTIRFVRESFKILDFDDTYYDLAKSLSIPPIKESKSEINLKNIYSKLSDILKGDIVPKEQNQLIKEFIFRKNKSEFDMSMTAEGIKKLGAIKLLLENGQINKDTILFIDEPDANLHPDAIRKLCEILYLLSKEGIQIFLATHNYFMINQFSILARREDYSINCIVLTKDNNSISNTTSDLKYAQPDNSIINEALDMLDDEMDLDIE